MSSGPVPGLRVEDADGVRRITFDRPEAFNALTEDMVRGLIEAVRDVTGCDEQRVVLLTGGTGAAFSAGADVGDEEAQDRLEGGAVDAAAVMINAITDCPVPVVAGLNGVAAGVGLSLAVACDLLVARESASVTFGFGKVGLMPDGGASATVAASIGRAAAMRLALLSDVIASRDALAMGLVTHVFPDDEYDGGLEGILRRLAAGPPLAHTATKRAINAATLDQLSHAFERERDGQAVLLRTADAREGMAAFNQRRRPRFEGH